jgi:hypothetical protein
VLVVGLVVLEGVGDWCGGARGCWWCCWVCFFNHDSHFFLNQHGSFSDPNRPFFFSRLAIFNEFRGILESLPCYWSLMNLLDRGFVTPDAISNCDGDKGRMQRLLISALDNLTCKQIVRMTHMFTQEGQNNVQTLSFHFEDELWCGLVERECVDD